MSAARLPARGAGPLIIAAALASLALVVLLPLAMVFAEALRQGLPGYLAAFDEPDTWAAVRLTLLIAAISVPLNAIFGLAAAWAIAKFEFHGKSLLVTLIDLPFSVSPVVSGLVWVLLFGANGWFGPVLQDLGIRIILNTTGVILA
ncbi:MAG: sulfate ABC transporter permease subunit CysW, partial [Phenylobacterium sp.]|nr:sulfate ABC transporter permease subunit CysW [Phenylobacterium sp.]